MQSWQATRSVLARASACESFYADGHLVERLLGCQELEPKLRIEGSWGTGMVRQEKQQGCWVDASGDVKEALPFEGLKREEGRGRERRWHGRGGGHSKKMGSNVVSAWLVPKKPKSVRERRHTGGWHFRADLECSCRPQPLFHLLVYLSPCLLHSPWLMGRVREDLPSK